MLEKKQHLSFGKLNISSLKSAGYSQKMLRRKEALKNKFRKGQRISCVKKADETTVHFPVVRLTAYLRNTLE